MLYRIEHQTLLTYSRSAVREHHTEIRLTPRQDCWQRVMHHAISVDPAQWVGSYIDYFGNDVDYYHAIQEHDSLCVKVVMEIETLRTNPFDGQPFSGEDAQRFYQKSLAENPRLFDYILHRSNVVPALAKLQKVLKEMPPPRTRETAGINDLLELMAWVQRVLCYAPGTSEVHSELVHVVASGCGVCQDFTHLFIALVRSWGIPARYVMGYLDAGICLEDEVLATHAWAEVLTPGVGWLGFDPVHGLVVNDRYVAMAVGRDSYDAAPLRGSYKGGDGGDTPRVAVTIVNQ